MSNLRNIQLLRNGKVYASLQAAKDALTLKASTLLDGSPIIGRYMYEDASGNTSVKTVIGIAHNAVSGETGITFFESANDIADAIAKLQSEMDATQAAVGLDADGNHIASSSHFTSAATTVEAEIASLAAALEALNYTKTVGESEVFSTITESEGKVSAETKNLTAVKLAGYAEGTDEDIAATDTLGQALGKLQAQINAMDKDASAVNGQVVTTVSEADGKVSETKANVKDLQLGGYERTNDTGAIASADTINVALSKIENQMTANDVENADGSINIKPSGSNGGTDINVNIKDGEHVLAKDGGNGVYTNIAISAVTSSELASLGTNVKEAYKLVGTDGARLGEYVKIYKDSALKEIYLGSSADTIDPTSGVITKHTVTDPQSLNYAYQLSDGTYTLVKVDVSKFLTENEFKSGVTVTAAGVVTGVVDALSEKVITAYSTQDGNTTGNVLSVGEDGFKVDNIQNAINAAVGKAQTSIDTAVTSSAETLPHMSIAETVADNGSKSYKFTTFDIASEHALDAEVVRAKAAEAALDGVLGSTKAEGSETRTWTKSGTHYVGSGVTVKDDIVTLDGKLFELSGKTVTDFTSANNSITTSTAATANGTVTVDLGTDASKISGLTAVADANEGAAKVSGVSTTDSVKKGIENLYTSLKSEIAARKAAISARTISSSNAAIAISETPNADGFSTTLTLTLDGTKNGNGSEKTGNDNALTITSDGLFLSTIWDCGKFDE